MSEEPSSEEAAYAEGERAGRRQERARERVVRAGDPEAIFDEPQGDLSLRFGKRQIDIERRWEAASILNDMFIGVLFVAGSVLNFFSDIETVGLVLYLLGSLLLLVRPFIRLARRTHVRRMDVRSRPRVYRPDLDPERNGGAGA
ncbi:YrhK family protein [Demequina globuliformis]|uniref:YrhK family protein n=1 Tax=Demequina globuliformis TaxID=676202 RepID=UPI000A04F3E9|nr:YrhK family protein [Demequina globuliformis]